MLKMRLECRIVAEDQNTGYWRRRIVTGRDIYSFLVALCLAMHEITIEAGNYHQAKEIEEIEKGDLPF